MEIRKASIQDLKSLCTLFESYRVFYRQSPNLEKATLFLKDRLSHNDSIIFLAEAENKKLVGFTQLFPSFSSTRMSRLWILNDLYVEPTFRGKSISKLLINQAKTLCKQTNACGIMLETEKTNNIGNNLYPAVGFELEKNNFYFWTNK